MSLYFGKLLKITIFGESHGTGIGFTADGLPAGEAIDLDALGRFTSRRRAVGSTLTTPRKELDEPEFLSGLYNGKTCGTPLTAVIRNADRRSSDYAKLADLPRPSHADFTAQIKWKGSADLRGGGHFSGRLTAPLVLAGGIALQMLYRRGIRIVSHVRRIGHLTDEPLPESLENLSPEALAAMDFPVLSDEKHAEMSALVAQMRREGDSVGGVIECGVYGLPAGLGGDMFGGIESRLSEVLFGIPAVKGVEFGDGFALSAMRGSQANDPFRMKDGKVTTETNHSGGILGGISTGSPVIFRVGIKPTPSIALPQKTVSLSRGEDDQLVVGGRHDPCIVLRAAPVVEAAAALVMLDLYLEEVGYGAF